MTIAKDTQQADAQILNIADLLVLTLGNSRIYKNKAKRALLRESIKEQGVLQAITVRPSPEHFGKFEVISGYGRWEESAALGLLTIPAVIKIMDDKQAFKAQLTENLVRDDLLLVDQAKSAQKFISMFEGDYKEAALQLGWTEKKLNDRVQLLRCTDDVLNALNENKIKIGHAIVLASHSEKLQNNTLKLVLAESWTVAYLKERAGKARRFLHTAKFDTQDCNGCPHNTQRQQGMFDFEFDHKKADKPQCADLTCWKTKTDAWLDECKKVAEDKFGKVLWLHESGKYDRNTVTSSVVGEEQYGSCLGCGSRAALMDNRAGKEGQVVESQCLDVVCFTKCTKALILSKQSKPAVKKDAPKKEEKTNYSASSGSNITPSPKSSEKKAPTVQKTPAAVTTFERNMLRQASCQAFSGNASFNQGVMLASLVETTGYECPLFSGKNGRHNFNDRILACIGLSQDVLQKEIVAAISFLANEHINENSYTTKDPVKLMVDLLATNENAKQHAIKAWSISDEVLRNYTIDGIAGLCMEAKFNKAFDNDEVNKKAKLTFAKISKKGKGEFIKAILAFEFDWSNFAPKTMLSHITNK